MIFQTVVTAEERRIVPTKSKGRDATLAGQAKGDHEPTGYEMLQRIPLGRMGEAAEFANLALFPASDAESYVTETAINVDGGMSPLV